MTSSGGKVRKWTPEEVRFRIKGGLLRHQPPRSTCGGAVVVVCVVFAAAFVVVWALLTCRPSVYPLCPSTPLGPRNGRLGGGPRH